MMSWLQVSGPLGVVLGYALTSILIRNDVHWTNSFVFQSVIYAVLTLIMIFTPKIYYSSTLECINAHRTEEDEVKAENKDEKENKLSINNEEIKNLDENRGLPNLRNKDNEDIQGRDSVNKKNEENKLKVNEHLNGKIIEEKEEDEISIFQHRNVNKDDEAAKFWKILKLIIKHRVKKIFSYIINY